MKYSQKIFLAVFLSTIIISGIILWVAYFYSSQQLKDDFMKKYSVFSQVLGDTLTQLDERTETLMYNTAKLVTERDDLKGTLSTEELKELRDELQVTHLFVVNKNGKFIRSTNEAPELIPNAFSFCSKYEQMITGEKQFDATPIIHPEPEPLPYKFLFVPNSEKTRLVEVGVRVDFIAQTLTKALKKDESISALSLYSPKGKSFGTFTSSNVDFERRDMRLPEAFPSVKEYSDRIEIFSKVKASRTQCCQCDKSNTSINGKYYYVLKSEISKDHLVGLLKKSSSFYFFLALCLLIFSYFFSRVISKKLVQTLEIAAMKVREIKESKDLGKRLNICGSDEVSYLANEFNKTLEVLDKTQQELIEKQKYEVKLELSQEVAHNIKTPLTSIGVVAKNADLGNKRILEKATAEIKGLIERLHTGAVEDETSFARIYPLSKISGLLQDVSRVYSECHKSIRFFVKEDVQPYGKEVRLDLLRFKGVITNIIENSIEAIGRGQGTVEVSVEYRDKYIVVVVEDNGKGLESSEIKLVGQRQYSTKSGSIRGVGVLSARRYLESIGGSLKFAKSASGGARVEVFIPFYNNCTSTFEQLI